MIDRTLAHYRITAKLGEGGMGQVYRAEDQKLGRDVALKVLPETMASDPDRLERFRREAKALAALDHPGIVTVYSVEEVDGIHFLTMALVEGTSLGTAIGQTGLAADRWFDIALSMTDALAAAHEKAIIHRDLKPDNLMITPQGRIKVLDFGLAKLTEPTLPAGDVNSDLDATVGGNFTRAGTVMGTAPYMSPEQIEGKPLDVRTDVFSLGIVLYEMATGVRPFHGESGPALISSILRDDPEPIEQKRRDLPGELGQLVARCLEKDREDRPATAAVVRDAIDTMRREGNSSSGPPQSESRQESVAVLPFANRSPDPDDEFFADGVTEDVMNALASIPGLRVAARTSAFSFKGKNEDLRVVGEKLNVATVLEGSVRKAGDQLRITAQLVGVADGYQIWSERYDRKLTDVFELQDEIAMTIADKLHVTLTGKTRRRRPRRRTHSLEAYELYLKGRALQSRRGRWLVESVDLFRQALTIDPAYADALAWMADAYRLIGLYGLRPPTETMPLAKEAAERALKQVPDHAEAYATLAKVSLVYDLDHALAKEHWDRALASDADHIRARAEHALWWLGFVRGAFDEAARETRRAVEVDPLSAYAAGIHAMTLGIGGRHDASVSEAARAVELDPDSFIARWIELETRWWAGDFEGAVEASQAALTMSGRNPWALAPLACAHAGAGRPEIARAVYQELQARAISDRVQTFWLAAAAAAAGAVDEAMDLAFRAIDERDSMLWAGKRIPDWAPLRAHARFDEWLEKVGMRDG